jgi:hypothetical protein
MASYILRSTLSLIASLRVEAGILAWLLYHSSAFSSVYWWPPSEWPGTRGNIIDPGYKLADQCSPRTVSHLLCSAVSYYRLGFFGLGGVPAAIYRLFLKSLQVCLLAVGSCSYSPMAWRILSTSTSILPLAPWLQTPAAEVWLRQDFPSQHQRCTDISAFGGRQASLVSCVSFSFPLLSYSTGMDDDYGRCRDTLRRRDSRWGDLSFNQPQLAQSVTQLASALEHSETHEGFGMRAVSAEYTYRLCPYRLRPLIHSIKTVYVSCGIPSSHRRL